MRWILRLALAIELLSGGLVCCFLSMAVPVVFLLGVIDQPGRAPRPVADRLLPAALFAVTGVLGAYCVFLALGPLFRRRAWGVDVALRQPRWPVLFRPVLAAYWAAHFLLGVALAFGLERLGLEATGGKSARHVAGTLALTAAAVFAFTYAANFYLLLALTTVTRSRRVVDPVWRWRVLVDVALTAVALFGGIAATT